MNPKILQLTVVVVATLALDSFRLPAFAGGIDLNGLANQLINRAVQQIITNRQSVKNQPQLAPTNSTVSPVANPPANGTQNLPASAATISATPNMVANHTRAGTGIYVFLGGSGSIEKYDQNGNGTVIVTGIKYLQAFAFDSSGNLYLADGDGTYGSGAIEKYDHNGNKSIFIDLIVPPDCFIFDSKDNLYMPQSGGIKKYDSSGNGTVFASKVNGILSLTFDGSGNLYVGENHGSTIEKFGQNGNRSTFIEGLGFPLLYPMGLAFDSGGFLTVAYAVPTPNKDGNIIKYDKSGNESVFASGLSYPRSVAYDDSGNLYVADQYAGTIMKYDFTGHGSVFASGLSNPAFVAVQNNASQPAQPAHIPSQLTIASSTNAITPDIDGAYAGTLHEAVKAGDVERVKGLFKLHPEWVNDRTSLTYYHPGIDAVLFANLTPLHEAAIFGQENVAEVLLANRADVNAKDIGGDTPLHMAALYGFEKVAEVLLANKADVNAKDVNGNTPLHMAASYRREAVVNVLLANNADVNVTNLGNVTPLHWAAGKGSEKIVESLLAHNAGVNAKDGNG